MKKPNLVQPRSATRRQVLYGIASLGLVGCGPVEIKRESAGIHDLDDKIHGKNRRAKMIIPNGLEGLAPLVVGLHDSGQKSSTVYDDFGWKAACAKRGWVGVFPTFPLDNENDDNVYIEHLIGRVTALAAIDPSRVYVMGHGGGGRRAYAIGCTRGDIVRAFAATSAVVRFSEKETGPQNPKGPALSMLHIHGGLDERVPLVGGPVKSGDHKTRAVPAVDDGLKHWIDYIDGEETPMNGSAPQGYDAKRWTGKGEEVVRLVDPTGDQSYNPAHTTLIADFFASLPLRAG
ncbi:MAG: hypothetical protein GWP91_18645 [Rhodobacterales bacterium]|nr:hypothetical protein [Rhodobacterales bacterium]